MGASWYGTRYWKLFFDFHSPGATAGLAAAFDAERWADRVRATGAQAISACTKCGYGYSFYQKGHMRYQHPHLPPGLDMLAEQIVAFHGRGIRVIGYYHTCNSEPIAAEHPEWLQRDEEGTPHDIQVCLLSPLLEEWMLPHIDEIVVNYNVDGMFFDGSVAHIICHCSSPYMCAFQALPRVSRLNRTERQWYGPMMAACLPSMYRKSQSIALSRSSCRHMQRSNVLAA